jgi:hypothetical protein
MRSSTRLVPVGFLLAAACSAGTGTGPVPADLLLNEAVASMAGEGAAQHVEMMRGPGGPHGFGFPADPSKFECTNGSHEGLTVTRHCLFEDIGNEFQEGYDPVTTETVIQSVEVNGTLDRGHIGGTIHRVSDLTVTGLAGNETSMTWYGTSTETSTRVHQAEDGLRQMDMSSADTIKQVVIPVPRTETSWPKSGTITRNVTVTFTGGPKGGTSEQRTATITFDGTQFATVTVNGDTFKFDLAGRGKPEHREGDGMHHP